MLTSRVISASSDHGRVGKSVRGGTAHLFGRGSRRRLVACMCVRVESCVCACNVDSTLTMRAGRLAGVTIETHKEGDGVNFPTVGKSVNVHYTGTLVATGATFDSSRTRGTPFVFTIGP